MKKIQHKKSLFFPLGIPLLLTLFTLLSCSTKNEKDTTVPIYSLKSYFIPYIDVEIEGKTYHLGLDMRTEECITLKQEVIDNLKNKKILGKEPSKIKFNEYIDSYLISEIKINEHRFDNIIAKEEEHAKQDKKASDPRFKNENDALDGTIDWGCFLKEDGLFLDFPNSQLSIVKDPKQWKSQNSSFMKEAIETPIEITQKGIILPINTDLGLKRFNLEPYGSISVMFGTCTKDANQLDSTKQINQGLSIVKSKKLIIGNKDFGEKEFLLINAKPSSREDGSLGKDFFVCLIFIDFQHKKAFIKPPTEEHRAFFRSRLS